MRRSTRYDRLESAAQKRRQRVEHVVQTLRAEDAEAALRAFLDQPRVAEAIAEIMADPINRIDIDDLVIDPDWSARETALQRFLLERRRAIRDAAAALDEATRTA